MTYNNYTSGRVVLLHVWLSVGISFVEIPNRRKFISVHVWMGGWMGGWMAVCWMDIYTKSTYVPLS
jgi:beta-glucanase (GH16 family)